jgi:hydroxysqualene dehydroxylase
VVGLLAPAQGGGPGFHWAFDRGTLVPPPLNGPKRAAWPLVLVASSARELVTLPTATIVERARAALEAYAITRVEPVAVRVIKEPRATPAFSPEAALARPGVDSGLAGLAFAGDWTATGLPATIEGAVVSGLAAARHVLGSAGTGSAILRHPTSTPSEGPA